MTTHESRDHLREVALFIIAELDADELAPDEIHATAAEGLEQLEVSAGWGPRPNLRRRVADPGLTRWMVEGRN